MEAAQHFGGAVNDHFKWKVDMKKYDIEVSTLEGEGHFGKTF